MPIPNTSSSKSPQRFSTRGGDASHIGVRRAWRITPDRASGHSPRGCPSESSTIHEPERTHQRCARDSRRTASDDHSRRRLRARSDGSLASDGHATRRPLRRHPRRARRLGSLSWTSTRDHRGPEPARYRSVVTLNFGSEAPPYLCTPSPIITTGTARATRSHPAILSASRSLASKEPNTLRCSISLAQSAGSTPHRFYT